MARVEIIIVADHLCVCARAAPAAAVDGATALLVKSSSGRNKTLNVAMLFVKAIIYPIPLYHLQIYAQASYLVKTGMISVVLLCLS